MAFNEGQPQLFEDRSFTEIVSGLLQTGDYISVENIGLVDQTGANFPFVLDNLIIGKKRYPGRTFTDRDLINAWSSGADQFVSGANRFQLNAERSLDLTFHQGIGIEAIRVGEKDFGLRSTIRHLAFEGASAEGLAASDCDTIDLISLGTIKQEVEVLSERIRNEGVLSLEENERYSRLRYMKEGLGDLLEIYVPMNFSDETVNGDIFRTVNKLQREIKENPVPEKVRAVDSMRMMIEDLVQMSASHFLKKTDACVGNNELITRSLFAGFNEDQRVRVIEGMFGPAFAEILKAATQDENTTTVFDMTSDTEVTLFDIISDRYRAKNVELYSEIFPTYQSLVDKKLANWGRIERSMPVFEDGIPTVIFMTLSAMLPNMHLEREIQYPHIGSPVFQEALVEKLRDPEEAEKSIQDFAFILSNLFSVRLPNNVGGGVSQIVEPGNIPFLSYPTNVNIIIDGIHSYLGGDTLTSAQREKLNQIISAIN